MVLPTPVRRPGRGIDREEFGTAGSLTECSRHLSNLSLSVKLDRFLLIHQLLRHLLQFHYILFHRLRSLPLSFAPAGLRSR